jgi:methyl-accepting chemotaxis protein
MTCKITIEDEVILLNNQNVYVKSIGIMSMEDFLKCDVPKDLDIKNTSTNQASPSPQIETFEHPKNFKPEDLQKYYNMLTYQSKIKFNANHATPNIPNPQANAYNFETTVPNQNEWFNPNQVTNGSGENSLVTIVVLILSALFGGGKVLQMVGNRLSLRTDGDNTTLINIDDTIARVKKDVSELEEKLKKNSEAIETEMSQMDDAIKELDSLVSEANQNNQRLMKRYEILLGDDTPDIEEISIRLKKIERVIKYIVENRSQIPNKTEPPKEQKIKQ